MVTVLTGHDVSLDAEACLTAGPEFCLSRPPRGFTFLIISNAMGQDRQWSNQEDASKRHLSNLPRGYQHEFFWVAGLNQPCSDILRQLSGERCQIWR